MLPKRKIQIEIFLLNPVGPLPLLSLKENYLSLFGRYYVFLCTVGRRYTAVAYHTLHFPLHTSVIFDKNNIGCHEISQINGLMSEDFQRMPEGKYRISS
jgi:hypothetical protein